MAWFALYFSKLISSESKILVTSSKWKTPDLKMNREFNYSSNLNQSSPTHYNQQYGYVVASGDERFVKLGMEGQTIVKETENADMSMSINVYKKYGIIILHTNTHGVYKNTSL